MDQSEPSLRVATAADRASIQSLLHASASAIFPRYYGVREAASAVRYVAVVDPVLLEDGTYFVLEIGGEPVACGGWSRRGRPYMGSSAGPDDDRLLDPKVEAAHVRAMFVRDDWQRRGLGRRILNACVEAASSHGFDRLDLVATLPGVPLYLAFGFRPTQQVEIVLADGVLLPCVAMTMTIGPGSGSARASSNGKLGADRWASTTFGASR